MILAILLGAPVFIMVEFAMVMVHLSAFWVIASLLFAPFAGQMYERAATAAGVQQDSLAVWDDCRCVAHSPVGLHDETP